MKDAINLIAINIVSGLALAEILEVSASTCISRITVIAIIVIAASIWTYTVPKLKERFERWKWRRNIRNETERIEFKDFKSFETAELMSGPFRENISINDENIFNEDMRKPLRRKKISSRLRRTTGKQKTNTVRFNVYKHINKNSNNK